MAEPTSTVVFGVTAGGVAVFGVATGLHPGLLIAGLAGGWWALSYRTPMTLPGRIAAVAIAGVAAAWGTPVAMLLLASLLPGGPIAGDVLQFPVALLLGRLAHTISAGLDALVKRKMEGV